MEMVITRMHRAAVVTLALALLTLGQPAASANAVSVDTTSRHASSIPTTVVTATLSDSMQLTLDHYSAPAGYVEFLVSNAGAATHELVVLRTDAPANALAPNPDEAGKALEDIHMGETGDISGGHFNGLVLALGAGHYSIICNEPGHYMAGMHVDFEVTAPVVNVTLDDSMTIKADQTTIFAGPVVFAVSNNGKVTHEFVILDTNAAPDQLPMDADEPTKVSEETDIGETGDIPAGRFSGLGITLQPGVYLVVCNEPGHFMAGMRFELLVLPAPTTDEPAE